MCSRTRNINREADKEYQAAVGTEKDGRNTLRLAHPTKRDKVCTSILED